MRALQGWVRAQDIGFRRALGERVEDDGDGDTGALGAELAAADGGAGGEMFGPIHRSRGDHHSTGVSIKCPGERRADDRRRGPADGPCAPEVLGAGRPSPYRPIELNDPVAFAGEIPPRPLADVLLLGEEDDLPIRAEAVEQIEDPGGPITVGVHGHLVE
jgi:hypothetical protein